MDRPTTISDELATILFELDEGSLATGAVTDLITNEIVKWAISRGWTPRAEARVQVPRQSGTLWRVGYIDVIIKRGGLDPDLAIEVDSADKPWSLTKLRHAVAAGMHGIWIRWGDEAWAGVDDEVDVIQLTAKRRSAHRSRQKDQLTLWS